MTETFGSIVDDERSAVLGTISDVEPRMLGSVATGGHW